MFGTVEVERKASLLAQATAEGKHMLDTLTLPATHGAVGRALQAYF